MNCPPLFTVAATVVIAVIAAAAVTVNVRQQLPIASPITCTVTDTHTSNGVEQVRHLTVDTAECGSLRIADPMLLNANEAADLHRSLEIGQRYTFETRGDRIEALGLGLVLVLVLVPSIIAATPAS